MFTITFFVGLHGDMAEGLMISTFIEEGYSRNRKVSIPENSMKMVYNDDMGEVYRNKGIMDLLFGF